MVGVFVCVEEGEEKGDRGGRVRDTFKRSVDFPLFHFAISERAINYPPHTHKAPHGFQEVAAHLALCLLPPVKRDSIEWKETDHWQRL